MDSIDELLNSEAQIEEKIHVVCPLCSSVHVFLIEVLRTIDRKAPGFGREVRNGGYRYFSLDLTCPNKNKEFLCENIGLIEREGIEIISLKYKCVEIQRKQSKDIFELTMDLTLNPYVRVSDYQPWCYELIRICIRAFNKGSSRDEKRQNFLEMSKFLFSGRYSPILENILDELIDNEAFLIGADTTYRDHVFHSINVFLSGYCILNQKGFFENFLYAPYVHEPRGADCNKVFNHFCPVCCSAHEPIDSCSDDVKDHLLRQHDNWNVAWAIASLFHDVGYQIEIFPSIYEKVTNICENFPFMNIEWSIKQKKTDWNQELKDLESCYRILNGAKVSGRKLNLASLVRKQGVIKRYDHGLVGAVRLLKLAKPLNGDKKVWAPFKRAALAIALHNLAGREGNKIKICAQTDPLSFLLKFCDDLQEWGRERPFRDNKKIPFWLERIELLRVDAGSYSGIVTLEIELNYVISKGIRPEEKKIMERVKYYFNNLREAMSKLNSGQGLCVKIIARLNNVWIDEIYIPSKDCFHAMNPDSRVAYMSSRIQLLEQIRKDEVHKEIWMDIQNEIKALKKERDLMN